MPPEGPRVWALTGNRRGDNNQVLGLADALGLPFEEKALRYNLLHDLPNAWLRASFLALDAASRAALAAPYPDLVISIGRRAAPIARAIKRRSGGVTKLVHLGYPRLDPRGFDLVLTTPQYPVPEAANVVRLPMAIGPAAAPLPPEGAGARFLARLARPRRLLLIGGRTRHWRLDAADLQAAIHTLLGEAARHGGSLILLGSPRTPPALLAACEVAIAGHPNAAMVPLGGTPSYAELLGDADRLYVTADSVSMISEALATGKPLGLVPIRLARGRLAALLRPRLRPRDLRVFWAELEARGLAGTVERPSAGNAPDVMGIVVAAVRRLLAR